MNSILIIGAIILLLGSGGVLVFTLVQQSAAGRQSLMGRADETARVRQTLTDDASGEALDALKVKFRKSAKKKAKVTLDEKFFQAGLFYQQDKEFFTKFRAISIIVALVVSAILALMMGLGPDLFLGVMLMGGMVGYQVPFSWLDRKILARADDILYYLPLVIEQVVVGVSSSLDIGPCLATVVDMADERESHNPVTDLIKRAQFFMKQGVPLEEAMAEVGRLSGHTELKHAFISLAQVARHGGEVTKQLQELADSVQTQRETKIDGKIKKLELEATGPVAFVFAGFLMILLIEFGLQVFRAFK